MLCVCRQAQVEDDSQDDDADRCPLSNDSRDVRHDDLSATRLAVARRGDATSATAPRRPAIDQANAVGDSVRQVPATTSGARGLRAVPSAPSPTPVDPRRPQRPDCSCPDAPSEGERRRFDVESRRPQSSPSRRGMASCGRVDSVGGVGSTEAGNRRATVTRANTTGGYLLQVPDVVYPPRTAPVSSPSDAAVETPLSSSLPERWPSAPATSTRHAPRVYYSNSEDRVSATDDETRPIVPSLPYSSCASPVGSPRLRRQPTRETRRLSVTETDEGWTQLNQYKLKDEIGKVRSLATSTYALQNRIITRNAWQSPSRVPSGAKKLEGY